MATTEDMAGSRKKVLVRMLDGAVHAGYAPGAGLLGEDGAVGLLDPAGRMVALGLGEIKWIAYVRDFNLDQAVDPENLVRRSFLARPRTEGLWVRVMLVGGETIEGLAGLDLSLADGLMVDRGMFLIPPDVRSNTQRLFVPRAAMARLQVLAVITTPSKPVKVEKKKVETGQEDLFAGVE